MVKSEFFRSLLLTLFVGCFATTAGWSQTVQFRENTFDVYTVDLSTDSLVFYWKDTAGNKIKSLGNLQKQVEEQGAELLFATNGGMYLEDRSPQGLYIENGETLNKINSVPQAYGNFYMQPNGIFLLTDQGAQVVRTTRFEEVKSPISFATQSGPMLLIDGEMHSAFREGSKNKYIRSGVGIVDAQHLVFVISNEPVNFYDFALFFQENYGCQNALYLDGAISRMHVKATGRLDKGGQFGCMIGHVKKK